MKLYNSQEKSYLFAFKLGMTSIFFGNPSCIFLTISFLNLNIQKGHV